MGKWKRYLPILLCFLCIAAALAFGLTDFYRSERTPMHLKFRDEGNHLTLVPYYEEAEDTYFLFLPSCTALSDLSVTDPMTGTAVPFSQRDIPLGTDFSVPRQALDVIISGKPYSIEVWPCDTLPTLFLQGAPDMLTKVHENKENKVTAQVKILDETGAVLLQDTASFSGRGNGTWATQAGGRQAKCPYNLTFSLPVSYGPFEDATHLCLFAEFSDESKLRNSLGYFVGQEVGLDYASGYTYVNVFVNGEYLGLYGMATKREVAKHLEEDQIQGIFECTAYFGIHTFYSGFFEQPIRQFYGDPSYSQDVVYDLEKALTDRDWASCQALMDLDSFALMYALEEFICNYDTTSSSQYFYIDPEGVVHTMLPWDFDCSLGSTGTYFEPHQDRALMANADHFGFSWYPVLIQWEDFRLRVADMVERHFTDELLEKISAHLLQDMDAIESSRRCDIRRWQTAEPYSVSPPSGMETLEEFYDFFTGFLLKRRDFLLDYFRNADDYRSVNLRSSQGSWYNSFAIPKGGRPADYIDEQDFFRRLSPNEPTGKRLATASGVPLSRLGAITEDIDLFVTEQEK